ncbi:MAG: glutamate synthase large subunit [SAR324 cluster bacterium]|nr:glutamate synthase large subunit [SAR324 cluster bacterium]
MEQDILKSNKIKSINQPFGLYDPKSGKDACGVGLVVDKSGEKSHQIIEDALEILKNLEHRGALGEDKLAGDGAGITTQIPHKFFQKIAKEQGIDLPDEQDYALGTVFLPPDKEQSKAYQNLIEQALAAEKLTLIGWIRVATNGDCLSPNMLSMQPDIRQFIIKKNSRSIQNFERNLYIARRVIENKAWQSEMGGKEYFYIPLISSQRIVYKGMLISEQLYQYFPDLKDPLFESALALVHQRYSTNTFPSWGLAHPFRLIAHNGEINTLRGNINRSNARECQIQSDLFGTRLSKIFPIIMDGSSDSSAFDNTLELLVMAGRSIEHALLLMMPQAWENDDGLDLELKSFYQYGSALFEAWDGPAAMVFCDGRKIGAMLDRNGLRSIRYLETMGGKFILASEAGVLDIDINDIKHKGKLGPGEMIMVDTSKGEIIYDRQIKQEVAGQHSYQRWVEENMITLDSLPASAALNVPDLEEIKSRQMVFGYTSEQKNLLLKSMGEMGAEATHAMGTDTPLAVLSKFTKSLSHYFKQSFAQVTNPAIDPIRESLVMSLRSVVGGGYNVLEDNSQNCHILVIKQPILTNAELEQLRNYENVSFRSCEVDICYSLYEISLDQAVDNLSKEVELRVDEGYRLIVLSDRNFSNYKAPIPSLLAVSAVHHYLIRQKKRGKVGLIIETGEAREIHDFACLIGYGAGAINPYLAFETISEMVIGNSVSGVSEHEAHQNYIKAVQIGLKKIFAKMGISTLQSYHAAQIFEVVGLSSSFVDKHFTGTITSIEGIGINELGDGIIKKHKAVYLAQERGAPHLSTGGEYHWRKQGEEHSYNPDTVHLLQQSAWQNDQALYDKFKAKVNGSTKRGSVIRGLFKFNYEKRPSLPLAKVESAESIIKRFCGGAISIGAIGKEVHETIAAALNGIGARSNTGEGGEDEARFKVGDDGVLRRSAIKQVASGRFGVTSHYLVNADEIQIKIAQGAKPGEGGQLNAVKIDDYIAKLRHTIPGVTLISPPPHHDIYSIEDLAQLIFDLKNVNPKADMSVKLTSSRGIGAVAAGVVKAKADGIVVAGYDGGTGASPATSIKHAGIPWEIGLAEVQQALVANNLRAKVKLQVDGQLKTGYDVVVGAMLGAEEFGFATSLLITLGCIMMRKCHLNTCPVGIATQNKDLRANYRGKQEYIKNYLMFVAHDVREIMADLGYAKFADMVGESDHLMEDKTLISDMGMNINLNKLLTKVASKTDTYRHKSKHHNNIKDVLDQKLIKESAKTLQKGEKTHLTNQIIRNSDRCVGSMLGGRISDIYGAKGLAEDTIKIDLCGTAGQSFGAFIPEGLSLKLVGEANDYVGKGLSGGKIIICPPKGALYETEKTVIVGNTCLYGATSGKVFIAGMAGQRFAVRNSGCDAVVGGVGDHGCEYMTGGRVVVLGKTGKNFAAGMSGGIAYIYDPTNSFKDTCNQSMVEIVQITNRIFINELKGLLNEYFEITNSQITKFILSNFTKKIHDFVMVIPFEYRKILSA